MRNFRTRNGMSTGQRGCRIDRARLRLQMCLRLTSNWPSRSGIYGYKAFEYPFDYELLLYEEAPPRIPAARRVIRQEDSVARQELVLILVTFFKGILMVTQNLLIHRGM